MPPRSGDARGEDEGREMWRAFKRKRMMHGRKRQSREQVRAFTLRLSCHQLFKGYVLPPTHLGTRVEVEKFRLLFSPPLPRTRSPDASFFPPSPTTRPSSLPASHPPPLDTPRTPSSPSDQACSTSVGRGRKRKREKTETRNVRFKFFPASLSPAEKPRTRNDKSGQGRYLREV